MIFDFIFGVGKEFFLLLLKEVYEWGDIIRLFKYSYNVFIEFMVNFNV